MTRALRGVAALALICWLVTAAPVAAQITLLLGAGPGAASGGGGGGGSGTWDPLNTGLTLSPDHLTATGVAGGFHSVLSQTGYSTTSTNNVCWSATTSGTNAASTSVLIGVALATQPLNNYVGGTADGEAWFNQDGTVQTNAAGGGRNAGTYPTTNGATEVKLVCVAFNPLGTLMWVFNPVTSQWNGDVIGNQNPAVGSQHGGYLITPGLSGTVFAAATATNLTVDFVIAKFTGVAGKPTGFSDWNVFFMCFYRRRRADRRRLRETFTSVSGRPTATKTGGLDHEAI